ncbi:uncharacterized protein BKA78DRAFT_368451 [Phyllosticta capitalensis]|uniref:Uncharacterized protein n=1 Tax=Phyllosticta capitalensis TaxID=121624 RepID=A0ABR1YVR9_9PEZI
MNSNTSSAGLGLSASTQDPGKSGASILGAKTKSVSALREQSGASAFNRDFACHDNTTTTMAPENTGMIKQGSMSSALALRRPVAPTISLHDEQVPLEDRHAEWEAFARADSKAMKEWKAAGAQACPECGKKHAPPCYNEKDIKKRNAFKAAGKEMSAKFEMAQTKIQETQPPDQEQAERLQQEPQTLDSLLDTIRQSQSLYVGTWAQWGVLAGTIIGGMRQEEQEQRRRMLRMELLCSGVTKYFPLAMGGAHEPEDLYQMGNRYGRLIDVLTCSMEETLAATIPTQASAQPRPSNRGRGGFQSRGRDGFRGRGRERGATSTMNSRAVAKEASKRKRDGDDDEDRPKSKQMRGQ